MARKNLVTRTLGKTSKLAKDKSGSVAVEFSIIAIPFLSIVFASLEIGWFYYVNAAIDAVTLEASREIRTGFPQENGLDRGGFYDEVCPKLSVFGECRDILTVEITTFDDFATLAADTSPPTCADEDPETLAEIDYEPGADNEIVRLRICLIYNTLNLKLGANLAKTDDGKRKVTSSYIFRNEPFSRNENFSG